MYKNEIDEKNLNITLCRIKFEIRKLQVMIGYWVPIQIQIGFFLNTLTRLNNLSTVKIDNPLYTFDRQKAYPARGTFSATTLFADYYK